MKVFFNLTFILIFLTLFLKFSNVANGQNLENLYNKIDLFS